MRFRLYSIGPGYILEVSDKDGDEYEYYSKYDGQPFEYAFSVTEPMTKEYLTNLYCNGFFRTMYGGD